MTHYNTSDCLFIRKYRNKAMTKPIRTIPFAVAALMSLAGLQGSGAYGEEAQQSVQAVATKVKQKATQSEKVEGAHDLVKDTVHTKTNAEGENVIEQVGEASYYGKHHQGKDTANGETFNQHALTAAHPTLPLGSEAKVTNLENGKSVQVKINDRGPYTKGRDIDLSKKAAQEIGVTKTEGEAPVKIEAVIPSEQERENAKPNK
jgi:rare lipoprotein A (peptidoglycan hydrolase)